MGGQNGGWRDKVVWREVAIGAMKGRDAGGRSIQTAICSD